MSPTASRPSTWWRATHLKRTPSSSPGPRNRLADRAASALKRPELEAAAAEVIASGREQEADELGHLLGARTGTRPDRARGDPVPRPLHRQGPGQALEAGPRGAGKGAGRRTGCDEQDLPGPAGGDEMAG